VSRNHDLYINVNSDKLGGTTQISSLMLCWTAPGTNRSRLIVLRLKDLEKDEEFFEAQRSLWPRVRSWTHFFVTVKGIHYVKASIPLVTNILAIWDVLIANGF